MNSLIMGAEQVRLKDSAFRLLGRDLQAGTPEHGYFGEFSSNEVITGNALDTLIGGVGGTIIASDVPWLGFALNGKRLLIAKWTLRHTLGWSTLNNRGVVYGKAVTIQGLPMLVRLPKGSRNDPGSTSTTPDHSSTHGSEWNRLMYHVSGSSNDTLTSEGITIGDWAQFQPSELRNGSLGSASFCQEQHGTRDAAITRGSLTGVSQKSSINKGSHSNSVGWRPVLELID